MEQLHTVHYAILEKMNGLSLLPQSSCLKPPISSLSSQASCPSLTVSSRMFQASNRHVTAWSPMPQTWMSQSSSMIAGCISWAHHGCHGSHLLQDLLPNWLCPLDAPGIHRPLPILPALQGPPDSVRWQGLVQGQRNSTTTNDTPTISVLHEQHFAVMWIAQW